MKSYLLLILSLCSLNFNSIGQDYYYYEGERIDLSTRLDKIAVILNETNLDKFYIKQTLNSRINTSAEICKQSINFFDGNDIRVLCFCIMPTHIHLVFELINNEKSVSDIMASVKRFSARKANEFLKRKGTFWQSESFDRLIRDEKELYFIIKYILLNPVTAGLVSEYKSWPHTYCLPGFEAI